MKKIILIIFSKKFSWKPKPWFETRLIKSVLGDRFDRFLSSEERRFLIIII